MSNVGARFPMTRRVQLAPGDVLVPAYPGDRMVLMLPPGAAWARRSVVFWDGVAEDLAGGGAYQFDVGDWAATARQGVTVRWVDAAGAVHATRVRFQLAQYVTSGMSPSLLGLGLLGAATYGVIRGAQDLGAFVREREQAAHAAQAQAPKVAAAGFRHSPHYPQEAYRRQHTGYGATIVGASAELTPWGLTGDPLIDAAVAVVHHRAAIYGVRSPITLAFQATFNRVVAPFTGEVLRADAILGPKTDAHAHAIVARAHQENENVSGAGPALVSVLDLSLGTPPVLLAGDTLTLPPGGRWIAFTPPSDPDNPHYVEGQAPLTFTEQGHYDLLWRPAGQVQPERVRFVVTTREAQQAHASGFHVNFGKVVHDVEHVVSDVAHETEAVASMIPGVGTAISSAIGVAEGVLSGGGPLAIALHTAYGAIPIPPGIRSITDGVLKSVLALIEHHGTLTDAAVNIARDAVPRGLPQKVFDTLIHIVHRHHPIEQIANGAASAAHFVTQYTQGLPAAMAQGMAHLAPPVRAALASTRPAPPQYPG
jgi:hypothetical protein